jgi:hypothetical protein
VSDVKEKKTFNLSPDVLATVRELAEQRVAPTQDAVIEAAVRELARIVRDATHAQQWGAAGRDPDFQAEAAHLEALFAHDDARAWDR